MTNLHHSRNGQVIFNYTSTVSTYESCEDQGAAGAAFSLRLPEHNGTDYLHLNSQSNLAEHYGAAGTLFPNRHPKDNGTDYLRFNENNSAEHYGYCNSGK